MATHSMDSIPAEECETYAQFELRRRIDDLVYSFRRHDDARSYQQGDTLMGRSLPERVSPCYQREDRPDLHIEYRDGFGWGAWAPLSEGGALTGRPWDIPLSEQHVTHPPSCLWVSQKGVKSYAYDLCYPAPLSPAAAQVLVQPNAAAANVAAGASRRVTFATAWSGVGKTTTGDYLGEYCGALHLDGDADMREPDHAEKAAATAGLIKSFADFWFKEKAAPIELWHPYYQLLVNRVLTEPTEADSHIVVSMSVYRREVRDFLREQLRGYAVEFLKLECEVDVVVRGAINRLEEFLQTRDPPLSIEEHWRGPSQFPGVTFAEKYGEYCFENFKKMQLELYLSGMEDFHANEPQDYVVVDVSSRDESALELVRAALGLPAHADERVDMFKLKAIQAKRWEIKRPPKENGDKHSKV